MPTSIRPLLCLSAALVALIPGTALADDFVIIKPTHHTLKQLASHRIMAQATVLQTSEPAEKGASASTVTIHAAPNSPALPTLGASAVTAAQSVNAESTPDGQKPAPVAAHAASLAETAEVAKPQTSQTDSESLTRPATPDSSSAAAANPVPAAQNASAVTAAPPDAVSVPSAAATLTPVPSVQSTPPTTADAAKTPSADEPQTASSTAATATPPGVPTAPDTASQSISDQTAVTTATLTSKPVKSTENSDISRNTVISASPAPQDAPIAAPLTAEAAAPPAATQTPPAPAVAASPPTAIETQQAPVTAIAPAITAPRMAGTTEEALSAALKAAVESRFAVKPAGERAIGPDEKKAHAAITAFYAGRAYQPLWVSQTGFRVAATQAIDRLSKAADDGLNAADYQVPTLTSDPIPDALAKAEIDLTLSTLKYARQAQAGRFDPGRLGELVTAKPTIPDPEAVLKSLDTAASAGANLSDALEAYNPPQQGYKRLKAKLAQILTGNTMAPVARVPDGPTIRPGQKDTRIALLRNRLGVTGAATADDATLYDDGLVEAVKTFQKTRGLKPSGIIGQQTVEAVNDTGPSTNTKAADIIANMERWRWLPRDLGDLYVFVNIPDFSLTVVRDGVVTHKARAIVGRVANPTPIFSNTMTHIIVNPYWNVPYSIVQKEYLAKAQETNGEALERGNFEVEVGNRVVQPSAVDWSKVTASQIHLRQRPGEGNALGNIKFMFPNQHSVYIHDTSSRGLFVQSYRSLSHGCVRVQDPFAFADALLADEPTGITGGKLKSMIGGDEKYLWLKKTIPVHIAYFTDFVDDAGNLQTRPDLYGHNAKTKQLLGL